MITYTVCPALVVRCMEDSTLPSKQGVSALVCDTLKVSVQGTEINIIFYPKLFTDSSLPLQGYWRGSVVLFLFVVPSTPSMALT